MNFFFPQVADQEHPTLGHALGLFLIQMGLGLAVGLVLSLFTNNSSGMGGVVGMVAGMGYAQWAEHRVPGSLQNPKFRRMLAAYSAVIQAVVGSIGILLVVDEMEPAWLVGIVFFVGILGFLITWWGLGLGAKQSAKLRQKNGG